MQEGEGGLLRPQWRSPPRLLSGRSLGFWRRWSGPAESRIKPC